MLLLLLLLPFCLLLQLLLLLFSHLPFRLLLLALVFACPAYVSLLFVGAWWKHASIFVFFSWLIVCAGRGHSNVADLL